MPLGGGREFAKNPLAGLQPQARQALNDAVALRHVEDARLPLRLVSKPGAGFPQRRSFSEIDHGMIVPQRLVGPLRLHRSDPGECLPNFGFDVRGPPGVSLSNVAADDLGAPLIQFG